MFGFGLRCTLFAQRSVHAVRSGDVEVCVDVRRFPEALMVLTPLALVYYCDSASSTSSVTLLKGEIGPRRSTGCTKASPSTDAVRTNNALLNVSNQQC